jgi:serine/threonine-protein kinase
MHTDAPAAVVAPDGLIVGRYRLLGPLGAGASATVWAAVDQTLGRQVALKLLSGPAAFGDADRDQLRSEARALAALAHPRVIVVFDYLEAPGLNRTMQPVLVTELLEGRDLATCLERGPLPWPTALGVCGQLAEALAAAHAAGIVHRDVAPANVMLTASGVKLLDFGIAQGPADHGPADGLAVGTPMSMAPEQLTGQVALPASDMYAFGCALHWCLTGRAPFPDKNVADLSNAHLHKAPPPLTVAGLPDEINEFYLACLAKDPAQRPTARQAAELLAPYARSEAANPAEPAGPAGPGNGSRAALVPGHAGLRRPVDRRRLMPVALLIAALGLVLALIAGLANAISGGGSAASRQPGGGLPTPQQGPSSAADSATATATATDSASVPVSPSAAASASAQPSASAVPRASGNLVLTPSLPDPATDPAGYLQAISAQVRSLMAQGSGTLQSAAGQNLLTALANLQNAVSAAQQSHGKKQWRTVQSQIAAAQQQIADDSSAGEITQAAASALSSELQQLANSLPTTG